ncbi:DUF6612 family protein [Paenibacillus turicensis]|uniref:DUF6612 family protein n=1 Tax=Paenibacillus turicensis TaxID=160487 RepID=UPI003D29A96A
MKKWAGLLLTLVLAVSITACGSKAKEGDTTSANGAKTENTSKTESNAAAPTLDELIKQAKEAKELKSYAMEISSKQNMKMEQGEQKQEQNMNLTMKAEYVGDPVQMHIVTNMDSGEQKQDIEQYVTKDGMYMLVSGQWMHTKDASIDEVLKSTEGNADVSQQLEQFRSLGDQAKITAEGDNYVINADVSGDKIKELAKEVLSKNAGAGANGAQVSQMLDMMNITEMKMTTKIQKDTLYPVSSKVKLVMDMEQEGQKMAMDMDMDISFSKHNEITEIKVPQEALDSAKK